MALASWQNCQKRCRGWKERGKGRSSSWLHLPGMLGSASQSPQLALLWLAVVVWLLYMLCSGGGPAQHR